MTELVNRVPPLQPPHSRSFSEIPHPRVCGSLTGAGEQPCGSFPHVRVAANELRFGRGKKEQARVVEAEVQSVIRALEAAHRDGSDDFVPFALAGALPDA